MASGWRRSELLHHYLTLPTVVGVLSAAAGNALGYTLLSAPMRNLYYNTYSLPPFESHFSLRAFLLTTLLPLGLLEGLTLIGLAWAMRRTPLEFLRREKPQAGILARLRHRTDHGSRLPAGLPFTTRFRLRLLLRGLPSFITLFLGITLSSFLLLAGLALLPVVENFSASLGRALPAEHVYVLSTQEKATRSYTQRYDRVFFHERVRPLPLSPLPYLLSCLHPRKLPHDEPCSHRT